jgi:hypothetical protein
MVKVFLPHSSNLNLCLNSLLIQDRPSKNIHTRYWGYVNVMIRCCATLSWAQVCALNLHVLNPMTKWHLCITRICVLQLLCACVFWSIAGCIWHCSFCSGDAPWILAYNTRWNAS